MGRPGPNTACLCIHVYWAWQWRMRLPLVHALHHMLSCISPHRKKHICKPECQVTVGQTQCTLLTTPFPLHPSHCTLPPSHCTPPGAPLPLHPSHCILPTPPSQHPNDPLYLLPCVLTEESPDCVQFTGKIYLPVAGLWRFGLNSDDGSLLYIDGAIVVNNDGVCCPPPHPPCPTPCPTLWHTRYMQSESSEARLHAAGSCGAPADACNVMMYSQQPCVLHVFHVTN